MNWYLTKLVFRIVCGAGEHIPQFDEQLRLITAYDEKEAFDKAFHLGKQEEDSFINSRNEIVQWLFINISEMKSLGSLSDGLELYSRIEEKDSAAHFINCVNRKAEKLRNELPTHYKL
ncbi:MAG: DUF4288 domain-containing protein [Chitinophagaceae bacterium]|nr:DUF4288 domain-containing protein [Chitinophagaceae bacterium]